MIFGSVLKEKPQSRFGGERGIMSDDICGLCGKSGADKFAHPEHWPGEQIPDTELVHRECEDEECTRAHALLSTKEREAVLRSVR